ncbi:TetR/AcrR family transcriptional regulator [Micrococcus luteus]|uniref:TetR/AcrR family transcriptional regulator n=1 Tax=Micrococcus luteus TaxID=1270 RepID=UPI001C8D1EAE|nr:TetR/AcrR family transcriptional regulator [Micrococcus luteus]MBY0173808.1 TetR family transcriptional regulator [Micrococcus luteus]
MKRSAEDAAKTRLALLEAALMSFEEKGWQGATFERVAERAGVTRGAVNHHFRSKSQLLTEALEWGWAEYGNRLFTQEAALSTAEDWLSALLGEFVRLLGSDERFRALASTTVLVAPQALDDSSRKHEALDAWRDQITASLREHADVPVPLETAAGLVLVLIQGFTVTAVTRPADLPQPEHLDAAIAALVRGLLS